MGPALVISLFAVVFALIGGLAWVAFRTPQELLAAALSGVSAKLNEIKEQTENGDSTAKAASANQGSADQSLAVRAKQATANPYSYRSESDQPGERKGDTVANQSRERPKSTDYAIVIFAFCSLIVAGFQAYSSWKTTSKAEQANAIAAQALEATKISAEATRRYAEVTEASQKTTEETAKAAKEIAEANKKAIELAKQSNDTAQKFVQTVSDTARIQLRAYIGVDTASVTYNEQTRAFSGFVALKNTGQTPANQFSGTACIIFELPTYNGPFQLCKYDKSTQFTVASGITKALPASMPPLRETEVAEFKAGLKVMWLFGEVTYKDVYKVEHFTRFRLSQIPRPVARPVAGKDTDVDIQFSLNGNEAN
jgi:hypothetical protein